MSFCMFSWFGTYIFVRHWNCKPKNERKTIGMVALKVYPLVLGREGPSGGWFGNWLQSSGNDISYQQQTPRNGETFCYYATC